MLRGGFPAVVSFYSISLDFIIGPRLAEDDNRVVLAQYLFVDYAVNR